MAGKRTNHLSWDDAFMAMSMIIGQRSKDPSTQLGAVIVNRDRHVVGIGYNGFPIGCSDDKFPWAREAENPLDTKYPYVVHAELNAILNGISNLSGCTLYCGLAPCGECAKAIVQKGISEIVYHSDKYADHPSFLSGRRILEEAGVTLRKYAPGRAFIAVVLASGAVDIGSPYACPENPGAEPVPSKRTQKP